MTQVPLAIGSGVAVVAFSGEDIHDPPIGVSLTVVEARADLSALFPGHVFVDWKFYHGKNPPDGYSETLQGCWPMKLGTLRRIGLDTTLHKFYFDAICRANREAERYGQSMFNHLCKVRPDLAEKVRGTDMDPFYCQSPANDQFDRFARFVELNWYTV